MTFDNIKHVLRKLSRAHAILSLVSRPDDDTDLFLLAEAAEVAKEKIEEVMEYLDEASVPALRDKVVEHAQTH